MAIKKSTRTRPNPFKDLTRSKALLKIAVSDQHKENNLINRRLYEGDHWMDGDGWIGPLPASENQNQDTILSEVRKVFNSRNVVKEVVDRKVDGLLKSRPQMTYSFKKRLTDEDSKNETLKKSREDKIREANELFSLWFKDKNILRTMKEMHGRSQLGERVIPRIFVPRGFLQKDASGKTYLPEATMEECLRYIHLSVLVEDQGGEILDEDTQLTAMVSDIINENSRQTDIVYVDEDTGETVIRTISSSYTSMVGKTENKPEDTSNTDTEMGVEWRLDLGKRLTMYYPKLRPIVNEQVRENQYAINLAKTMQNRNVVTAGFLERILLDAMPPGKWVQDPNDPDNEIYEVGPFKTGSGTTNFFMAAEYRDKETGETKVGSPSVYFRDPVDPATFIASKRDCYQDILEEVGQPHILVSGDATASGKSREQARETYRGTLEDDEGELNPMIAWMMEVVLAMASNFAGSKGYFKDLTAEAKCYINMGPLTGNERQDNREDVKAGQLSARTSMMRSGVEAPEVEFERIAEETGRSSEDMQRKTQILAALVEKGFDVEWSAKVAGLSPEQMNGMKYTKPEVPKAANPIDPNMEKDKVPKVTKPKKPAED